MELQLGVERTCPEEAGKSKFERSDRCIELIITKYNIFQDHVGQYFPAANAAI
jgi:hypothetical protein